MKQQFENELAQCLFEKWMKTEEELVAERVRLQDALAALTVIAIPGMTLQQVLAAAETALKRDRQLAVQVW